MLVDRSSFKRSMSTVNPWESIENMKKDRLSAKKKERKKKGGNKPFFLFHCTRTTKMKPLSSIGGAHGLPVLVPHVERHIQVCLGRVVPNVIAASS